MSGPNQTAGRERASRLPIALRGLVGRRGDLDAVETAVAHTRAVCLIGPGGCGKTRLAIEVARRRDAVDPGSVCWVDLAPFSDPGAIPRAIANALDVHEAPGRALLESVISHLGHDPRVLVLDNCEHLQPECARVVGRLLNACGAVRIVATSREVLGVAGELVWQVPPLTVPLPDAAHAQDLVGYESVELFLERARAVRPGFAIDEGNAGAVARICRGLDGLPLALELAAARMRVLTVDEIAAALEDGLAVLSGRHNTGPDRHRSLRAVLDWSHRLLTEPEQRLFAQLSVFTDGFGLDAARAVHDYRVGDPELLDLVAHLVDRSLLVARVDGGRTRYLLPETVRIYAAELLQQAGGTDAAQQRMLHWCVAFVERAEPELSGPDQTAWLDRVERERSNISAVLRRCLRSPTDVRDGLRIVAALWRFCYLRGYYTEGRGWLDALLTATTDVGRASPVRARALVAAGNLAFLQCAYAEATDRLEDALAAHRELGDERGVAAVLQSLGSIARERGRFGPARALHEQSQELSLRLGDAEGAARSANYLSLLAWLQDDLPTAATFAEDALSRYRALGDAEGIAWSLMNLGAGALYGWQHEQSGALLRESLGLCRSLGYREGVAWSLNLLGLLAIEGGGFAEAGVFLTDSLREHWALGDRWRTASVLEAMSTLDARTGRAERAARVLGAAGALRTAIGAPVAPVERRLVELTSSSIDHAIGMPQRADAERLGRLASTDRIVDELLAGAFGDQPTPQVHTVDPPADVELEVLATDAPDAPDAPGAPGGPGTPEARLGSVVEVGPPLVKVTTLGGCRVHLDDTLVTAAEFGYAKPRELLCFLLDRGEATKEQIGVALWPWASPARLRGSFHTTLHHLRNALPADRIQFGHGRYRFSKSLPYSYDVELLEQRVAQARQAADSPGEVAFLVAAVELYRGDYLADLVGESWIDERRRQLRRVYERALASLTRLHARAGRYDDAIDVAHRAVAHEPLSEAAHRELMRCYAAAGQRTSALRQYEALADLLRAELSTPPAPETSQLHALIRRGDPVPIE